MIPKNRKANQQRQRLESGTEQGEKNDRKWYKKGL